MAFGRQLGSVVLAEATDCHALSQGLPELTAKVHHACLVLLPSVCCPDAYQQCHSTESGVRCRCSACDPADATATALSLASLKFRLV